MISPLIRLSNISAGYDSRTVISGISFDLYPADFLGVTGANGGGKTTLLRVIMGLLPHSSGSIIYSNSLIINNIRRIGYLPQQIFFDRSFPISVADVVLSGLQVEKKFSHSYTSTDRRRVHNLLTLSGIAHLENSSIGEISGGQMQRALLCRAIISEPRLLILDEPTTFVDQNFEDELKMLLTRLNTQGTAILMVSHNKTLLTTMAKRVITI